jgi:hypothetical protein
MSAPESTKLRRTLWKRWLALWPVTAALVIYPVRNGTLRVVLVVFSVLLWTGLIAFFWRIKWLRLTAILFAILAVLFLVLPGKPFREDQLRARYLDSLRGFEGTRYVWGGENGFGIDCSGLVRQGLIHANLREAVTTGNPRLLRDGVSLWWNDCSARSLAEEYRGLTRRLFRAESINQLDETRIQPGDLAVTEDGIHVMAFLERNTWIEADPDEHRVIKVNVPSTNLWFQTAVMVVRWSQLGETNW